MFNSIKNIFGVLLLTFILAGCSANMNVDDGVLRNENGTALVPAGSNTLQINISNIESLRTIANDTFKVGASSTDTNPEFLFSKLVAGTGISLTKTNAGGNETINISTTNTVAENIRFQVKATEVINKGQPVIVTGYSVGQDALQVELADQQTGVANGLAMSNMGIGDLGYILQSGKLTDLDTSSYTEGAILYVNGAGILTETEPATGFSQPIAYVLRSNINNGALQVNADYPKQGADDVRYNNNVSGLTATNVQEAIDELKNDSGNYLLTTGDTATGNYTFDGGTLFIDSTNNRVGIGTTAPTTNLDLDGGLNTQFALTYDTTAGGYGEFLFKDEVSNRWSIGGSGINTGNKNLFYIYQYANTSNVTPSNAVRLSINDQGKTTIGGVGGTSQLEILGSGTTSATTSFMVKDSSSTEMFSVRDDGQLFFNAYSQGSIPFIGAAGEVSESNSKLYWDNTNEALLVGTNVSPLGSLTSFAAVKDEINVVNIESNNNNAVQLRFVTDSENRRFLALNSSGTPQSQISFGDSEVLFSGRTDTSNRLMSAKEDSFTLAPTLITPQARLHVKGNSDNSSTKSVYVENSASEELFSVRDDGFVGIGTATPDSKFHVVENANATAIRFALDNPTSTSRWEFVNRAHVDNYFAFNYAGIPGAEAILTNEGDFMFRGGLSVGLQTSTPPSESLFVLGKSSNSSTYNAKFENSASTNLMSIRDDGLITIGATTPTQELTVNGDINVSGTVYYGALQANSPILETTHDPFVTRCTVASDGEWVVSFIENAGNSYKQKIEKVDPNSNLWYHEECSEKINNFELIKQMNEQGYYIEEQYNITEVDPTTQQEINVTKFEKKQIKLEHVHYMKTLKQSTIKNEFQNKLKQK